MASLNGSPVQRAHVYLPGYGIWSVRVTLAGQLVLAVGQRVSLLIGDLTLSGTVRRGGSYVSESSYLLVGGADGWQKRVVPRIYRADNGVRSANVTGDLAVDTGEAVVVDTGLEPFLGAAWSRDAGLASDRLADVATRLSARVWMTPDGVTHLGKVRHVAELPAALKFTLGDYDPARGRAVLAAPEDKIAAFQPGTMLRAPGLEAFLVASVEVDVEPGEITVTCSARDPHQLFNNAARARDPARLHGHYAYQVREQTGKRLSVRALEVVSGLPDELLIDVAHGIAGASEVVTPGQNCLVGFRGGSPAAPYVAAFLPSASPPVSVTIPAGKVNLGGGSDLLPPGGETGRVVRYGDLVQVTVAGGVAVGPIIQQASTAGANPIAKVDAS